MESCATHLPKKSRSRWPLPSLPSSVPHEIVLCVATSAWLHNVPGLSRLTLFSFHCVLRAAEAKHLRRCDAPTLDGSLSTRYEKVSGIVNISRMAVHAAQQHVLLECLEVRQLLVATTWPSTPSNTSSPKKLQTISVLSQSSRLFSLQNKPTENPATNPCSHHDATEKIEEFTPFCAAHTVSPFGAITLHCSVTWCKRHEHCRRNAYNTSAVTLGWITSCYADGGRVLCPAITLKWCHLHQQTVLCSAGRDAHVSHGHRTDTLTLTHHIQRDADRNAHASHRHRH